MPALNPYLASMPSGYLFREVAARIAAFEKTYTGRPVISLVFGSELFARGEDLSVRRQGWQKFLLSLLMLTAVFLLLYLWVEDAGMHPFWFLAVKFAVSLVASTAVSLLVANLMLEETGERWK